MYVGREETFKKEIKMTRSNIKMGEKIVKAAIKKDKVERDNLNFVQSKGNVRSMRGISAFAWEREMGII